MSVFLAGVCVRVPVCVFQDEIPKGPVPEGIWQLNAKTFSLKGRHCAGMDYKIGDITKSSLIINRGYDENGRAYGRGWWLGG